MYTSSIYFIPQLRNTVDWHKVTEKSKAASKRSKHEYQLVPEWLKMAYAEFIRDNLIEFGIKEDTEKNPFDFDTVHDICQGATRTQRNYRHMQGAKDKKGGSGVAGKDGEDDAAGELPSPE